MDSVENGCRYRAPTAVQVGCRILGCSGCGMNGVCDIVEASPIDNGELVSEDDMPLVPKADEGMSEDDMPLVPMPPPVLGKQAVAQNTQRRLRVIPQPIAPTRAQREAHNMCHLEYAAWCEDCVRSRALQSQRFPKTIAGRTRSTTES